MNRLIGLQVTVNQYKESSKKFKELTGNPTGTIGGKCSTLKIDPSTEDFIQTMEIQIDKEQIVYLKFTAFSGKSLGVGIPDEINKKIVQTYSME